MLPGGYFVSGSRDHTLRVWREETGKTRADAQQPHERGPRYRGPSRLDKDTLRDRLHRRRQDRPPVVAGSRAIDAVREATQRRTRHLLGQVDGAALLAACADGHLRTIDPDAVQVTRDIAVTDAWLHTVTAEPDGGSAFVGGTSGVVQAIETR